MGFKSGNCDDHSRIFQDFFRKTKPWWTLSDAWEVPVMPKLQIHHRRHDIFSKDFYLLFYLLVSSARRSKAVPGHHRATAMPHYRLHFLAYASFFLLQADSFQRTDFKTSLVYLNALEPTCAFGSVVYTLEFRHRDLQRLHITVFLQVFCGHLRVFGLLLPQKSGSFLFLPRPISAASVPLTLNSASNSISRNILYPFLCLCKSLLFS